MSAGNPNAKSPIRKITAFGKMNVRIILIDKFLNHIPVIPFIIHINFLETHDFNS